MQVILHLFPVAHHIPYNAQFHFDRSREELIIIAKLSPKPQLQTQLGAALVLFPSTPTTHPYEFDLAYIEQYPQRKTC